METGGPDFSLTNHSKVGLPLLSKQFIPSVMLYRRLTGTTKFDIDSLPVLYRVVETQDSSPEATCKLILVRPYFSSGSNSNEFGDQWITEEALCQVFDRIVIYNSPHYYRVAKSIVNIVDPQKVNETLKNNHILFVPDDIVSTEGGILAMLSTHSKIGSNVVGGVNTVVLIEEYQAHESIQQTPILRVCGNGSTGFYFKAKPGVGYRIIFENSNSYALTLYSNKEFNVDEESKYLTEEYYVNLRISYRHNFQVPGLYCSSTF
jgi:hypothetical protein